MKSRIFKSSEPRQRQKTTGWTTKTLTRTERTRFETRGRIERLLRGFCRRNPIWKITYKRTGGGGSRFVATLTCIGWSRYRSATEANVGRLAAVDESQTSFYGHGQHSRNSINSKLWPPRLFPEADRGNNWRQLDNDRFVRSVLGGARARTFARVVRRLFISHFFSSLPPIRLMPLFTSITLSHWPQSIVLPDK